MQKQISNKVLHKNKGFSLVTPAIVLAIVGIVGSGLGVMYSEQRSLERAKTDQARLVLVKKAIIKFVEENRYMPCPDTDNDGLENREPDLGTIPPINAVAAQGVIARNQFAPTLPAIQGQLGQAQIDNVPVNVCDDISGDVPFESLNISRALVEGIDGNRFIYSVDLGVINPNNMLDCPNDSACFFNSDPEPDLSSFGANLRMPYESLPAFDATTLPVSNTLGVNNLIICSDAACNQVLQEGLIGVLLSEGPYDHQQLAADEIENLNNDAIYVKRPVTRGGDRFNDLILGIAANEVRSRTLPVSAEVVIDPVDNDRARNLGGTTTIGGNGELTGTDGTNIGTDDGTYEIDWQLFDFGVQAAGKTVALTFDTHAVGGWNKAASEGISNVFDDRGAVYARNSDTAVDSLEKTKLREFAYDRLDGTDWNETNLEQVTFVTPVTAAFLDAYNQDGSWDDREHEKGQQVTTWAPTWDESHEYFVTLDEMGKVIIDFEVETTATMETIEFSNIKLGLYEAPPDPPDFPLVKGIRDIPQTQELNNDKSLRFDSGDISSNPNGVVVSIPRRD